MKTLKSFLLFFLLAGISTNVSAVNQIILPAVNLNNNEGESQAKNIYLSAQGNDAYNGITANMAVKTLSMALTIASDNDTIRVTDFIDLTKEPSKAGTNNDINVDGSSSFEQNGHIYNTWNVNGNNGIRILNRNIIIIGENIETCGFDGKLLSRLLRIEGVSQQVSFKSLTFRNGSSIPNGDSGAGLYVRDSNPLFDDCRFIDNKADQNTNNNLRCGGAFYIDSDIKITNSYFAGNISREGSAIYINSGKVELENCNIENHDNSHIAYANGGALYVTKGSSDNTITNLFIKHCVFKNNKTNSNGGAICFIDKINDKSHNVYIESSAFIGNESSNNSGGAISFDNSKIESTFDLTIINSTFYNNKAKAYGGAFYFDRARVGSQLNLINCTITENRTVGNNEGMGPGFRFHCSENTGTGDITTKNIVKRIYNCIIENNYTTDDATRGCDISFRAYTPENDSDFFLHNSFVGRIMAKANYIPLRNNGNYYGYGTDQLAGLATPVVDYIAAQNCIPIYTNAVAYKNGNAVYLQERNINTDQVGNCRAFINGKCAAGSVELAIIPQSAGSNSKIFDHLIMYGQSLSTGHQAYPAISTENVAGNSMIGNQLWINYGNSEKNTFKPLIANIATSFRNGTNVMSRSAGTIAECPLFGAANHIRQSNSDGNDILATSAGTSGTTIEELSKESQTRTYYNDFLYSLIYAAKVSRSTNSTISCPAIFWMQGEYNYSQDINKGLQTGVPNTNNKYEYKNLLLQLKNNMQKDVLEQYGQSNKPILITYQTGAQYARDTLSIAMAQLEASNENMDIVCAGPVYPMTDRGGHLDPNGYRWFGEMLGKVYYKTNILNENFRPLQPKEICRETNLNQIRIKFHVPVPPLVFDEKTLPKIKNFGFEVYLDQYTDSKKQSIINATIDGDDVIITCANSLSGNVIVMYAGTKASMEMPISGRNTLTGHGNLRDSDMYPSFYKYIDLDKKNPDESFVYPRENSETTLRPDHEPKDASGNFIYEQNYPLYNFCLSFYYVLKAGENNYKIPHIESVANSNPKTTAVNPQIKLFSTNGNLYVTSMKSGIVDISCYNMNGQFTKEFSSQFSANVERVFSLNSLSSGLYITKSTIEGESYFSKIIIL